MKQMITRIILVGVLNFALFEGILRLSVRWRESSEELALTVQTLLLLIGIIWAVLPVFRQLPYRFVYRGTLAITLFIGFWALTNFYSWHVRPNIGFYEEPAWVAQHPGFQKELRARIEANRWW